MTEDALKPLDVESIARAFRQSAYNAYRNTLIGNARPRVMDAFNRMKKPVVGDWVFEASTCGMKSRPDLDGIGILEAVEWEKIDFGDPDFVWDEAEEGGPWPTEEVFYIRTMDGRRFRWTNAMIIAILNEDGKL